MTHVSGSPCRGLPSAFANLFVFTVSEVCQRRNDSGVGQRETARLWALSHRTPRGGIGRSVRVSSSRRHMYCCSDSCRAQPYSCKPCVRIFVSWSCNLLLPFSLPKALLYAWTASHQQIQVSVPFCSLWKMSDANSMDYSTSAIIEKNCSVSRFAKIAAKFIAVVDFVAVQAPRNHKVNKNLAGDGKQFNQKHLFFTNINKSFHK